ncbi:hypothetical protein L6452_13112 [Arctium lappa]|uniref:Uncharacterized protein n=1 Tax=Arctium lappa TaxID=4217 RepID=A0ACB9CHD2_ARCLA|nr:hypothetical protein L6452_13112 [Arctium lappa]
MQHQLRANEPGALTKLVENGADKNEEDEETRACKTLFKNMTFFTSREVKPKGVTMTALLAKASAMSLVQHPVVNVSCKDGKSFTYNNSINIVVVVAINGGFITPILLDADKVCSDFTCFSF